MITLEFLKNYDYETLTYTILMIIIGLWFIKTRNSFVVLQSEAKVSYGDIYNTLKKKYDLLDSLINVINKQMAYEKEVHTSIATLRSGFKVSEQSLDITARKIYAVREQYPVLGSNTEFTRLSVQVSDIENEINAKKDFYNACANVYNIAISKFPQNIVANLCGYEKIKIFQYSEKELITERKIVKF